VAILDNSHKNPSLFVATKELSAVAEFVRSSYGLTAEQCLYNTRKKIYPDGSSKVLCCSKPIFNPNKLELSKKTPKKPKSKIECNREPQERADSIKRSKDKVKDIALMNSFDGFITLTLSKDKINRYDKDEILKRVGKWLDNMVNRHGVLYLLIPEEHKDGAIHFHGFISGDLKLIDSGLKTKRGQTIYNLKSWRLGFSTYIPLDDNYLKAVGYVSKYITKDTQKIFGNRYFAGGKGLKREVPTEYFNTDYVDFDGKEYQPSEVGYKFKYKDIWEENNGENDLFD